MIATRALALSGLLVFSAVCFAQATPDDPSMHTGTAGQVRAFTGDADWDALDSNKDGYLTKDELMSSPALVHDFDRIDTDHDGKISMGEWKAYGHGKH